MIKKSILKSLVLVLALTLVLAACGDNNSTNTTSNNNVNNSSNNTSNNAVTDDTEQPKEVEFTIGYAAGDPATKQAVDETVEAFMEANPHVTIENHTEVTSASYLDWLRTKDAVGEFPDLVEMRDVKVFNDAGKIAELPEELHSLFSTVPVLEGKNFVAPITGNSAQGIIYSKKAYTDAGITELPKTYDEFIEIQEKLLASGISPTVVGGKDIWHMGFWVNKFLMDSVYADDPDWNSKRTAQTVSFTDPNMVQAITDYKEYFNKYVNEGWLSTGDNQTASVLVTGKAAQLYSGAWMFGQIEEADPNFEFGFYAPPARDGRVIVNGLPGLQGWAFSTEAAEDPDKVAAMSDFIRFFFQPEQYSPYLSSTGAIPTTKEEVSYEAGEQMQEVLRIANDSTAVKSMQINGWFGDNAIPPQFRDWFYKLLQELVVEDGDVMDYMQQADEEYDHMVEVNKQ